MLPGESRWAIRGDTPFCPPGGDTAEKRWGLGLEFRKSWAGSWGQARACRDHGKSPVSQTCSLGPLATWQWQSRLTLLSAVHRPCGLALGPYYPEYLSLYFPEKTPRFYSTTFFFNLI